MDLIVSLPKNDIDMARAAAEAGASAIKIHMNVRHDASGTGFGTFAEEEDAVRAIITAMDIPVGLMPGADPAALPEMEELWSLAKAGLDFIDIYAHHMPLWFIDLPLRLIPAFSDLTGYSEQYRAAAHLYSSSQAPNRIWMIEASITPKDEYGQPFTYLDFSRLRALQGDIGLPLLVPTQKAITPDDATRLADAGIGALMIGAIVTGDSTELIADATARYRHALDR